MIESEEQKEKRLKDSAHCLRGVGTPSRGPPQALWESQTKKRERKAQRGYVKKEWSETSQIR